MATKDATDAVRKEMHATLGELETLRDEVKVRIHLAGLDAKKAWDGLDPEYLRLKDAAEDVKDEALHAVRDGLVEVRKGLTALRTKLEKK